jgi:hypothetical protein
MTSRLETTTVTVGKLAPVDWERQQRASAPTLRDLVAATETALANASASQSPGSAVEWLKDETFLSHSIAVANSSCHQHDTIHQ